VGERLSELEKWRIAELAAQQLPSRVIGQELGRSHRAVWGCIRRARVPAPCAVSLCWTHLD
jgi:IS30 family transposase